MSKQEAMSKHEHNVDVLQHIDPPFDAEPLGPGLMQATVGDQTVQLPLKSLSVRARLAGPIAHVDVRQAFSNTTKETLEAVYIFPLGDGVVDSMVMKVGDREIRAELKERGQAREDYDRAILEGRRASLLEQERPNVFTFSVGNIPPGETIEVSLTYAEKLQRNETEMTFRFPLVVAPRYIPGTPGHRAPAGDGTVTDTIAVPDASRITPTRLLPGVKPGVNLDIDVEIDTGGRALATLRSSQHAVCTAFEDGCPRISLSRDDELLNRDYLLRYSLQGTQAAADLWTCSEDSGDAYFMLELSPPEAPPADTGAPRNIVFVLDRSGSMMGPKMDQARKAVADFVETLGEQDHFTIIAFDTEMDHLSRGLLMKASDKWKALARKWLRTIDARGGTEIIAPLEKAMAILGKAKGHASIVVITDGQVGNEGQVYRKLETRLGATRLFCFGVDTAVNDAFLRRMASKGRGTYEATGPGEDVGDALGRLAREIGRPLITDLAIRDAEKTFAPLHPLPDLYAARPSWTLGTCTGATPDAVVVAGKTQDGGEALLEATRRQLSHQAVRLLWAKDRIEVLEDRFRLAESQEERDRLEAEILELALHHRVLSRFTAFVAVDQDEVVNEKGTVRKVVQPVEMPAQWEMPMEGECYYSGFDAPQSCIADGETLLSYKNFGDESLEEVKAILKAKRLSLDDMAEAEAPDRADALSRIDEFLDASILTSEQWKEDLIELLTEAMAFLDDKTVAALEKLIQHFPKLSAEQIAEAVRKILAGQSYEALEAFWKRGV